MKKIILFFTIFFSLFSFSYAENDIEKALDGIIKSNDTSSLNLKDAMKPDDNAIVSDDADITTLVEFTRDAIFNLLGLITVGVFLYFGFRLIKAEGNKDEMKKILTGFIYAIIGLAVIPLAWAVVKLISTFNF